MRQQLKSQEALKGLMADYYRRLDRRECPVAWCTSVGPAELLRALGFEVYFPENHAALLGARRLGSTYVPIAGREGFAPEVCSYLTADIGAYLLAETPLTHYGLTAVPAPDVLVYNTNQCREVKEWFTWYGERFHVPVVGIATPRSLDTLSPALLAYLEASWREVTSCLESVSGMPLDLLRFADTVELSRAACGAWQEFLESNRRRPALHTFFDHVILMAPVVVLRGRKEAVAFYRDLVSEVASMDTSSGGDRYRFFWEGMPVWGKLRFLSEIFDRLNVDVVASTYCHSWTLALDGARALSSCVEAYASIFITRSQEYKLAYLKDMSRRFGIDAVLFHDSKTCPYNTNSRFGIPVRLETETGLPTLIFCGDLVDMRHFSEAEFALRLEAFVEQLGEAD